MASDTRDTHDTRPFIAGDRVILRPEWQDGNGDEAPLVIVEWNGDRGFVQPETWAYGPLVPRELVRAEMIEHVSEERLS